MSALKIGKRLRSDKHSYISILQLFLWVLVVPLDQGVPRANARQPIIFPPGDTHILTGGPSGPGGPTFPFAPGVPSDPGGPSEPGTPSRP